ncbi:MAG: phage tail tape measure protein, partial [Actinobacteria bacterium]
MQKDIEYRLIADPLNMERGFKSAEQSARVFERELRRLEAEQRRIHDAMQTVGETFLAGGAAIAAGLGLAVKAAVSWESAWTGVAKVVDGTPEQMAELEEQIRALTRVLPQSHEEIAAVAAAAGQLGVRRQDIAQFTQVMVNMGVATNLSSEEAAFALARLMNIMQTAPSDVDRLGSAIVGLGNNFATTEAEIVAMALRIAGAGNTIRMSEADVLGYAAALSSVGIMAEAGGTAISTAFIKIESAVRKGGDDLQKFARVAGMSAQQFRRAYEQDSARAIAAFVEGLGRIQRAGGDVFATLEDLGMSEIRLRDAMLRLAGAGDVLTNALDISNESWDENRALLEEAERRYQTTEARMQLARNAINDLAIDIGQTLLPVVGEAADAVQALGAFFADLPGPVQAAVAILAALAATLLLIGGTALIVVPRIAAYREAVETLANAHGRLATMVTVAHTAMSRVG